MENNSMIHVENLQKHFKKAIKEPGLKGSIKALFSPKYDVVKAVDGISFDVNQHYQGKYEVINNRNIPLKIFGIKGVQ